MARRGKVEIKTFGKTGKLATLSVATPVIFGSRWKTEDGASREKTDWHRITVFAPRGVSGLIARIETMVQKGTRVRMLGRPGDPRASGADEQGRTRPKRLFVIEFVLGPFAELEILARGKPSDALGAGDTDPVAAQLEMEAAA